MNLFVDDTTIIRSFFNCSLRVNRGKKLNWSRISNKMFVEFNHLWIEVKLIIWIILRIVRIRKKCYKATFIERGLDTDALKTDIRKYCNQSRYFRWTEKSNLSFPEVIINRNDVLKHRYVVSWLFLSSTNRFKFKTNLNSTSNNNDNNKLFLLNNLNFNTE